MSSKPISHLELVQPLQSFLETFTQELTEQKFVPALRDELKRLIASLEGLQQSEDTLQQIARGVDRLREVFAPAGTRLLEGVKDLETAMRTNSEQLRERAGDVLTSLTRTHEQLEGSLRGEAGLLQEQAQASREALSRTVAEVETRLSGLNAQVDTLCRKLEAEAVSMQQSAAVAVATAAPVAVEVPAGSLKVDLPDDLRDLLERTERSVTQELEVHRQEIAAALKQGRSEESDRLSKLDQKIAHALARVAPSMQEELDTAVTRLRDQIQTLILAEVQNRPETRTAGSDEEATPAATADLASALTASETRILREISTLQRGQKSEQTEGERILKELARGLEESAHQQSERMVADGQAVKDSMVALGRLVAQLREDDRANRDQLSLMQANLDSLVKAQRENQQTMEEDLHATLSRLDVQTRTFDQKVEDDKQAVAQLAAALSRSEQAATKATELALADSRAQRERIDAGLKDLRERIERSQVAENEHVQDTLRRVAEAWTEALEALRDFVQKTITSRTDSIVNRLEGIENRLSDSAQSGGSVQREVQNELRRSATAFEQRLDALSQTNSQYTEAISEHVKAVSGEVAALRSKQDQALAVLKEAIRANYDDNAARLKTVIDQSLDSFLKQAAAVPQALDRYSHLVQSLYQGDKLALEALSSDTANLLALSTEKFETLASDSSAMKKFFPLLDKKLEKQSADLENLRKGQSQQGGELMDLKTSLSVAREVQESSSMTLRDELRRTQTTAEGGFATVQEQIQESRASVNALSEDLLPAFRREMVTLIGSKLEFIERTLAERQEALRKDIAQELERERAANRKTQLIVTGLLALGLLMQLIFHFSRTPGVGK
jgi:hypothetical protein